MKKLKFIMLSNNKKELEFTSNYIENNNKISFKDKKALYELNMSKRELIKKIDGSTITIELDKKNIIINVQNKLFDMPIENVIYKENKKEITIQYTINQDEKIINKINIILEN